MKGTILARAAAGAALAFAAVTTTASTAMAQFELNIVGSANVRDNPGSGGAELLIDFLNPVTSVPTTTLPGIVPFVTTGTILDVIIDATAAGGFCVNCPINPFLTIGGYTFTLDFTPAAIGDLVFGSVALNAVTGGTQATLSGFGTVTGGSFGTDVRNFSVTFTSTFTGDTPLDIFNDINSGGTRDINFGADFLISAIPEPSTYALMATGLIGLIGAARIRRRV